MKLIILLLVFRSSLGIGYPPSSISYRYYGFCEEFKCQGENQICEKCQEGYTETFNFGNICNSCPQNCQTCVIYSVCLKCFSEDYSSIGYYYLEENNCKFRVYEVDCQITNDGHCNISYKCKPRQWYIYNANPSDFFFNCEVISECNSTDGLTLQCDKCRNGFYLSENGCKQCTVLNCIYSIFITTSTCSNGFDAICEICQQGYFLAEDLSSCIKCTEIPNCYSDQYFCTNSFDSICGQCHQGFSGEGTNVCEPILIDGCQTLSSTNKSLCISWNKYTLDHEYTDSQKIFNCKTGYVLIYNSLSIKQCIPQFKDESYYQNKSYQKCTPILNCQNGGIYCTSQTDSVCLACSKDSIPIPFCASYKICGTCLTQTSSQCVNCKNGFFLQNNKCQPCFSDPLKNFFDQYYYVIICVSSTEYYYDGFGYIQNCLQFDRDRMLSNFPTCTLCAERYQLANRGLLCQPIPQNCPKNSFVDQYNKCYCESDKYVKYNTCVNKCPAGDQIYDFFYEICICLDKDKQMQNNQCVKKCPAGDQIYDFKNEICICTDKNFKLQNNQCIRRCPEDQIYDTNQHICKCIDGKMLQNKIDNQQNQCQLQCKNADKINQKCKTCSSDNRKCKQCEKGYTLKDPNSCVNKCCPQTSREMIIKFEDIRSCVYRDTKHILTVGIGFNLERGNGKDAKKILKEMKISYNDVLSGKRCLSNDEINKIFELDLKSHTEGAKNCVKSFNDHSECIQKVLIDMSFNMGPSSLCGWPILQKQLINKQFEKAANNIKTAPYCSQIGDRCTRNQRILRCG